MESHSMIDEKDEHAVSEKEVHFVQFESVMDRFTNDYTIIWQLLKHLRNVPDQEYEDWVITDFDHCLKGNDITGQ